MVRPLLALLAAALLPGCAWFGGSGGDDESTGPAFSVAVQNTGDHEVRVDLEVAVGGSTTHTDGFEVPAGETVRRDAPLSGNETHLVRVTYTVDAGGRASSGSQELAFDPAGCAGVYRVSFEVRPGEDLTFAGGHGVCDNDA